jgi:hypothetical protein
VTKRESQAGAVALGAMLAMSLTLWGGCVSTDGGEIGTFLRDVLLNATAAWLL